jgi:hypothetical protein
LAESEDGSMDHQEQSVASGSLPGGQVRAKGCLKKGLREIDESDTPRRAGGLVSGAASKAVAQVV